MDYKIFTKEEFDKEENLCYERPIYPEDLYDDTEEIFEEVCDYIELDNEGQVNAVIKEYSKIPVYTKKYFQLPTGWIREYIEDYAEDNWDMEYPYTGLEGIEIIEKFEQEFNKAQTWYISGELVGYLDMSKEVEEYIKELKENE